MYVSLMMPSLIVVVSGLVLSCAFATPFLPYAMISSSPLPLFTIKTLLSFSFFGSEPKVPKECPARIYGPVGWTFWISTKKSSARSSGSKLQA